MIAHLRGTVLDCAGQVVVLECAGVGYEVTVSTYSMAEVGPPGTALALRVHTHFNKSDTSITLYGFTGARERRIFDLLITVKNVGPASAVKILSAGVAPEEIARLIATGQVRALQGLRGVGKKTAELLVVELRDRCEEMVTAWGQGRGEAGAAPSRAPVMVRPPILEDVASALAQLGWRPAEVDKAVGLLAPEPEATFEALLRQALRTMPR